MSGVRTGCVKRERILGLPAFCIDASCTMEEGGGGLTDSNLALWARETCVTSLVDDCNCQRLGVGTSSTVATGYSKQFSVLCDLERV